MKIYFFLVFSSINFNKILSVRSKIFKINFLISCYYNSCYILLKIHRHDFISKYLNFKVQILKEFHKIFKLIVGT